MVILHFFKLVRLPNLLMIALTQYFLRYFIIKPLVEAKGFELVISHFDFFLISLSTVLIAAAGYVINDYFDLKIDQVNKPDEIIVGRHIKRRVAMGAHVVMNSLGVLIGGYISYKLGNINMVFLHLFAVISLWYYSTNFKYLPLAGNAIIALMAGMVPLLVGLYEVPLLNQYLVESYAQLLKAYDFNFNYIAFWTLGYSAFAFVMTLAREITKDIQDIEGDEQQGANTLPIAIGIPFTKIIVVLLNAAVMIGTYFVYRFYVTDLYTLSYFGLLIVAPLFANSVLLIRAQTKKQLRISSGINKWVSFFGITYALLFSEILKQYMDTQQF